MFLDEEAKVVNVQLNQSSGHPELDEAAIRSASLFQWTPALNRDKKMPVWVSLPIAFVAAEGDEAESEQPKAVVRSASLPGLEEAEEPEQWIGLPRGVVSGTVRDSQSGQPLRWVQVWIPATSQGTLTNEEGRFLIPDVPIGSRGVMFQLIGYVPAGDGVDVRAGEEAVLDLGLQATALGYSPLVVHGGSGM